nr:hypothetical protein [Pedobacter panaciterrae]
MLKKSVYIFLLSVVLPVATKASAYWMEIKGSGKINKEVVVELIYGNIDDFGIRHRQQGEELKLAGDFRFTLITPSGEKIPMKLALKSDCWSFSFNPETKGVYRIIGINDSHPVVDRSKTGGENVLPIDYLCGQYQIGDDEEVTLPQQFLYITTKKEDKHVRIKAFVNNKISKEGTKLRVFNPENWERELILNENGEALFIPTTSGMYVIRQDFVEKKPGIYKDVKYNSIRYRCNYCLFISEKS